jgi:mevalonate kinase
MLKLARIDLANQTLQIILGGNLLAASGVGSSAASCAAFARALDDEFKLGMDDNKINEMAYEGEKAYHGSPSGVDNTAATFGGLIEFTKGDSPKVEQIKTPTAVEIVMGNTGLVTNTVKAVNDVKERKEKEPERFERIFSQAKELIPQAKTALITGDFRTVGKLMGDNHTLLQEIEVSCPELDLLVGIAKDEGAWGAKMTGSGLGGYMIALTPGQELQETVAEAITKKGFNVLKTKIGI